MQVWLSINLEFVSLWDVFFTSLYLVVEYSLPLWFLSQSVSIITHYSLSYPLFS